MSDTQTHTVVIGAGVAGLAAAIRLAVSGQAVTLLERHNHPGGKIRTTPSAAGPVDAGPTVLTMRHVFDELFEQAGTRLEDKVTLHRQNVLARHFWADGSQLDLFANHEDSAAAVHAFAGSKAAAQFDSFCARCAQLFDAFDLPMMQAQEPKLATLARHVLSRPELISRMAPLSTLSGLLRRQFTDPRMRQLFGRYATYVGGAPHLSPAVLALIWHAEASGVWVVDGGMHRLAQAMADLAASLQVTIQTDAHVSRIEMQSGQVTAVSLEDGSRIRCNTVVHAGDPRALAVGDLGSGVDRVALQTRTAPRSFSAIVHSFAAEASGLDLAHHNVFFADEGHSEFRDLAAGRIPGNPTLYLCAEDRGTGAPPPPLERFEIIANAPATDTPSSPKEIATWHQQIMTRMRQFGMRFDPMPAEQTMSTPTTFATMFPASQGALYGQSPHGLMAAFKRPTARTPVTGLYLCGGGTHPGAGVPMATLSGKHAAEAILNDQTSTSPLARTAMRGGMSTA